MEWTTQSDEGQAAGAYGNGHEAPGNGNDPQPLPPHDTQPLPAQPPLPPQSQPPLPQEPHPPLPEESVSPPVTTPPAPVPTHAAPMATPQAPSGFEHCPSCGALVAADQRYCLECGHRRGEPRLPFMDAVVFMDAMNQPPESASAAPKKKKKGISPNAALIAGVGTLLLALGIGVLIGRSGDHGSAPASQAPIVIHGGTGEEAAPASSTGATTSGGGSSTKGKSKKQIVKQKKQEAESGKGAEEVLHTAPGVKLAPPTVKIGEKCDKEVAGCSKSGHFNGSFFGE